MEEDLKIVFIGKSGVGKSSFINYFIDENLAETGAGEPVTDKTFNKYRVFLNDINYTLYDSWGLEGGKTKEWQDYFNNFLNSQAQKQEDIDLIVYCLSSETMRVEEFEKGIINDLLRKGYSVTILVTKVQFDTGDSFHLRVKNIFPSLDVVQVCNIETRIGLSKSSQKMVLRRGKEDFINQLKTREQYRIKRLIKEGLVVIDIVTRNLYDKLKIVLDDIYRTHKFLNLNNSSRSMVNISFQNGISDSEIGKLMNVIVRSEIEIKDKLILLGDRLMNKDFYVWENVVGLNNFCNLSKYLDMGILSMKHEINIYKAIFEMIEKKYKEQREELLLFI